MMAEPDTDAEPVQHGAGGEAVSNKTIFTEIEEFKKFHVLITKDHPEYQPFYFTLNKNGKDPIEGISWKKNRKNYEQAIKWLEMGYNVGIAATDSDKLVIMDKDDLSKVGATKPTLTITSRKRIGEHSFYFTDDNTADNIFDDSAKQNIATEEYGEIRANWQYVVCAGSYVPVTEDELLKIPESDRANAGRYTVAKDLPVNSITFDELPDVYKDCLKDKRETEINSRINKERKPQNNNKDGVKSALYSLTIQDVTGKDEDSSKRFASLFHGSDTGMNTSNSKGLLHCWRHNVSHTPLTALAVLSGIGSCGNVGYGHRGSGTSSLDLEDGETVFRLWENAKKTGMIPDNDPIPSKALVYYAINNKLCSNADVMNGWKLPTPIYNEALNKLEMDGIRSGRQPYTPKREPEKQTCGSCKFCPRGGVGGCRNPENDDKVKNQKKQTDDEKPACDKFKKKSNTINNKPEGSDGELSYEAVARQILEKYPIITLKDNPDEMYYFEGGVYKYGAESIIRGLAQFILGDITNKKFISEVLYYIQNATFIDRDIINKDKYIINVKNGLYSIQTKKLEPHSEKIISTCQIPVEYNPSAKCREISRFLCEISRPRDIALILQEFGYALIPDYTIQKAFLWNGSGLNGKGTLGRLLIALIGARNKSSETLQALNTDRFSSSNLYGKLVNIDTDLANGAINDDTMFKKLTGGDSIPAERKFQNRFEFRNQARLFYGANDLPPHQKGGFAWARRWIITDFPVRFDGKLEDKELDRKLQTPLELSGLLNLCLMALDWLLETKTFFYDKTPEQVGEEYLLKSNSVMAFMTECTTPADSYVRTPDLYQAYLTWAKAKQIKKIEASNIFGKLLHRGGYIQNRPFINGKQIYTYDGFEIDYTKLAGLENGTQLQKNQDAYTHWCTKNSQTNGVSWDLALYNIIQICKNNNTITNNEIISHELIWMGNPTNSTNQGGNEEKPISSDGVNISGVISGVTPPNPANLFPPAKPVTESVDQKAWQWEQDHRESITTLNLIKAAFDLKPNFTEISADALTQHLRRYAKLTPNHEQCVLCQHALNGNAESTRFGVVHESCKWKPIKIRILKDIATSSYTYGKDLDRFEELRAGSVADIPGISALSLISRQVAERIDVMYTLSLQDLHDKAAALVDNAKKAPSDLNITRDDLIIALKKADTSYESSTLAWIADTAMKARGWNMTVPSVTHNLGINATNATVSLEQEKPASEPVT